VAEELDPQILQRALADPADEIAVIEGGALIARGTHDELLEMSDLYREIVEKGLPDQVFLNRDPVEKVAGL